MTKSIELVLSEQETNAVLNALAQQPYAQVVGLISKLMEQVKKQQEEVLTPAAYQALQQETQLPTQ